MTEKQKRLNDVSQEKGVSNWLTALPLLEHCFDLNKQQFWDCIHIRYGWELKKTCQQHVHVVRNLISNIV